MKPQSGDYPRIGCDEVGKGDFFGPLVVCAAYGNDPHTVESLESRDSKTVSDSRVKRLAPALMAALDHSVVRISPKKYNELYGKFKNINRILGWAHATAVKNLLEKGLEPKVILIDRFGPEDRVLRHFSDHDLRARVLFQPRAEADPLVAAASIIARYVFLEELRKLSIAAGRTLPLGAGPGVDTVARRLLQQGSHGRLEGLVKLHFKNYQRLETGS